VRPAILTGADSHYSVARSAGILGLGMKHVIKVPLDDKRRMRADAIEPLVKQARENGLAPIAIVASACSTPIGAFDPIPAIADAAERLGLWLHVDGAHGASVLFSKRHRALVAGIDRADSVTWDAHKMLFTPFTRLSLFAPL
jgi:L-2,4-diaminobutyrate decarboxylase